MPIETASAPLAQPKTSVAEMAPPPASGAAAPGGPPVAEAEPVKMTRELTDRDADDESDHDVDVEVQDVVGSKRRGIRLKQDLN
jgi:hypothetical protein